jgi:voltage-gated potassium channel
MAIHRLRAATDTFRELAIIYIALLLICATLFMWLEGQAFWTSLYWAATTATSTGYGDLSPKTTGGQILAVALMHISIFGVAPLIVVRLVDRLNEDRDAFTHEEQLHILEGITRIEARLDRLENERGR